MKIMKRIKNYLFSEEDSIWVFMWAWVTLAGSGVGILAVACLFFEWRLLSIGLIMILISAVWLIRERKRKE